MQLGLVTTCCLILLMLFAIILNPLLQAAKAHLDINIAEDNLGGRQTSSPTASSWGADRVDVFMLGGENAVWHMWYDGEWNDWELPGGFLTSAMPGTMPSAVSCAFTPNWVDVFYKGSNSDLWHFAWNGEKWTTPEDFGVVIGSSPSATCNKSETEPNYESIYYEGPNGHIWRTSIGPPPAGRFQQDLGGAEQLQLYGRPSVIQHSGVTDIFFAAPPPCAFGCRPLGGPTPLLPYNLWQMELKGGSPPATFTDLGGQLFSAPSAVVRQDIIDVFYQGINGNIWHREWNAASGDTIERDTDLGSKISGSPYALYVSGFQTTPTPDAINIFYEGPETPGPGGRYYGNLMHGVGIEKCPSTLINCTPIPVIESFKVDGKDYEQVPLRSEVTLTWTVKNCLNCFIEIKKAGFDASGRYNPNFGVGTNLPVTGSQKDTVYSSSRYFLYATTPSRPTISNSNPFVDISGGGGGGGGVTYTHFYFKLQGNSEIVPCYVVDVYASDHDTAKNIAQSYASNYQLTDSNVNEFNNHGDCQQVYLAQ